MRSYPIQTDLIIKNGIILSMNSMFEIIHADVVISKGIIEAIIPDAALKYHAFEIIDAKKNLVIPGLINSHGHAAMSFFRGYAPDRPVREWLTKFLFPQELKQVTSDFVYWATKLSCLEMIASGTTCFVDSYYFEESVAQAALEMKLRAIVGQAVRDGKGPDASNAQEGIEHAQMLMKKWGIHELIKPAIAPHSAYTCSEHTLQIASHIAKEYNAPFLMHCAESVEETENGLPLFTYLEQLGVLETHLIAAHVVHIVQSDIEKIKQYKVGIAHCPVSNMKLGSGIAPIIDLLNYGIEYIGLGTDGPASNNSLDMFGEMKTAALAQKIRYPTDQLTAQQTLYLATKGAAQVLRMEESIGSIEVGKKADLAIVDIHSFHQQPVYNFYEQLIYSTKASDVLTTIVNGAVLYHNKQFVQFIAVQIAEVYTAIKKFKIH